MGKSLLFLKLGWLGIFIQLLLSVSVYAAPTCILIDKKTNQLHVSVYENEEYRILKSFHATLGRVQGDKTDENDLKTPEGIYLFNSLIDKPPRLISKFGVLAITMNYPNSFDQIAGHTGSGIMLHGTNDPERLKRKYDSEGCVVVKNEEVQEIHSMIRLGLSPILIFSELTDEWKKSGKDEKLKVFFSDWLKSWENKKIEEYISHYHPDFSSQGKNKENWKKYKNQLNSNYSTIQVNPKNIIFYRHPKYSVVTFEQNYLSTLKNGKPGYRSKGTKILYVAEDLGVPKIIAENFTELFW